MSLKKITPPLSGTFAALAAIILSFILASCSKDEILSDTHPEVNITAQQGDTPAVSYYTITDSTGIGFTSQGIEYTNQTITPPSGCSATQR